jgi:hypothetical protein
MREGGLLKGLCVSRMVMIVGFMFTNNSIGTLPALFLLGVHLFYGARNLFYGTLTTMFVSVLTETSKARSPFSDSLSLSLALCSV